MNKEEIREARELLRGLYKEYSEKLHEIISKIDKDLEVLENVN